MPAPLTKAEAAVCPAAARSVLMHYLAGEVSAEIMLMHLLLAAGTLQRLNAVLQSLGVIGRAPLARLAQLGADHAAGLARAARLVEAGLTEAQGEDRLEGDADTQLPAFLSSIYEGVHLFQGVTDSTMGHGEGWQFIQVGRYIERASATASLLNLYHREFWGQSGNTPEGSEYLEWIGLLRSCTAFEAYCKTYTADLNPDRILEFLLLNPEFPHAVRYSIDCLQTALDAIHGEGGKRRAAPLTRLAGRLQASLGFGQISEILSEDVGSYLQGILYQCRDIHEMIYQLYINYSIQTALAG